MFFSTQSKFPQGKLLTCKDVIEQVLYEDNWITKQTSSVIAQELVQHWTWCNVYTTNVVTVKNKVFSLVDRFYKLTKWPKNRRRGKFVDDVKEFMNDVEGLFDNFVTFVTFEASRNILHKSLFSFMV